MTVKSIKHSKERRVLITGAIETGLTGFTAKRFTPLFNFLFFPMYAELLL